MFAFVRDSVTKGLRDMGSGFRGSILDSRYDAEKSCIGDKRGIEGTSKLLLACCKKREILSRRAVKKHIESIP